MVSPGWTICPTLGLMKVAPFGAGSGRTGRTIRVNDRDSPLNGGNVFIGPDSFSRGLGSAGGAGRGFGWRGILGARWKYDAESGAECAENKRAEEVFHCAPTCS